MWNKVRFIGVPQTLIQKQKIFQGTISGTFAYFRMSFSLEEAGKAVIDITANSRYRLYINENPVLSGPCRGDYYRQYYETVDVSSFLCKGNNVAAVQVLYADPNEVLDQYDKSAALFSIAGRPCGHLLAVEGQVIGKDGKVLADLTTGEAAWDVYLDGSFRLEGGDEATANLGSARENIDFEKSPYNWKSRTFQINPDWERAEARIPVIPDEFEQKVGLIPKFPVKQRPIPLCFEEKADFSEESLGQIPENGLMVRPFSTKTIVLDSSVHMNAYLSYRFSGGKGGKVSFTYCEKYFRKDSNGQEIRRDDARNGVLKGLTDTILLPGDTFVYQPFLYRTFRYIQIAIQAGDEAVYFFRPTMRRTGFPLNPQSVLSSSQKWVGELWDICERTLQNCMMETYMDCPFYEQMQFVMDTRLQMLFTYAVGGDRSLAGKALEDFHNSIIPDGLTQGKYPSGFPQVISTFSLYYIFALEEYYQETGDSAILKRYRSDVDAILEYYDRHIGESGLVEDIGYWPFVDWQKPWADSYGVPVVGKGKPSTIINLMYGCALRCGAAIFAATGRSSVAEEYLKRQKELWNRVVEKCWDQSRGLFREAPSYNHFSQHAQAWAVLNGFLSKEKAASILQRTLTDPDVLQCSFSTSFELFRAFELAECYEKTEEFLAKWKELLKLHCTTCPEEPVNGRSECHGWSALPLYELTRVIAGVKAGSPGWKSVIIEPHLSYVSDISGTVGTPYGTVGISMDCKKQYARIELPVFPQGARYITADKQEISLHPGVNEIVQNRRK